MVKEFIDQYIASYPRDREKWSYDDGCLMLGAPGDLRRDGSVAYYLSEPKQVDDAKGTGAFLMAYAEYLRVGRRNDQGLQIQG